VGLVAKNVAELAKMIDAGPVSATAGNTVIEEMAKTGKKPKIIAEEP